MSWWSLKNVKDQNRVDFANYAALPPDACYCGTPLEIGWVTVAGGGREMHRKCPMGSAAEGHVDWVGGPRPV